MGPKTASIFTDAPALGLEATISLRGFERDPGNPLLAFLGSVKPRKMLADDFFRLIPLESLSACVPARHTPFRIEHVNRIIGDALDQQFILAAGVCHVIDSWYGPFSLNWPNPNSED